MFGVSKSDLDRELSMVRSTLDTLNKRYWELYAKHERLMSHLGLIEVQQSSVVIEEKAKKPERP